LDCSSCRGLECSSGRERCSGIGLRKCIATMLLGSLKQDL
jgi:hypothetical protein